MECVSLGKEQDTYELTCGYANRWVCDIVHQQRFCMFCVRDTLRQLLYIGPQGFRDPLPNIIVDPWRRQP